MGVGGGGIPASTILRRAPPVKHYGNMTVEPVVLTYDGGSPHVAIQPHFVLVVRVRTIGILLVVQVQHDWIEEQRMAARRVTPLSL